MVNTPLFLALATGMTQANWSMTVSTGAAYNFPTGLVIRQEGYEDIRLTARWETRPFAEVPYYDVRFERGPWELELVHHKLYLANRPGEVEMFEITHGYNFITANRTLRAFGAVFRAGAGFVLAHPESEIRGRRFDEHGGILWAGWYVSGPVAQLAAAKRFRLRQQWFLEFETKMTGAWARVPIADGNADVPNLAAHGLVGVGFRF